MKNSPGTSDLIKNQDYEVVSNARSGAREFAVSSCIDQVDLVHLAKNMGTEEGERLAEAILEAVKYNRTSSKMTNSYGMSIYFPFRKISTVDEAGDLLAPQECTWIAVNDQPVAYYHESTVDDGEDYTITGRIPVLYNEERAELVVEFTDEEPYGSVVGVRKVYADGETDTVAKTMNTVSDGDTLDFICDYYSYDGEYLDSYRMGDRMIVDGELAISDVYVDGNAANLTYLFTDIYNQKYWTEPLLMQ